MSADAAPGLAHTVRPPPTIAVPEGFTRELLIAACDREIRLRERSYPRWVALGRMSAVKMRDEIAAMKAVRAVLAQLPPAPPAQPSLFPAERLRR